MKNNFIRDVKYGSYAENVVINLFNKSGWTCSKSKKGEIGWDIKIEKENLVCTLEVKYDKMSDITNNIAIEYFNPKLNKGSGITASTSDFWIYCFGKPLEIHTVSLKFLKSYIDNNPPFRIIQTGGDNNASLLLYKKDKLINELFWRIDNIDIQELNTGLQNYIDNETSKQLNAELERN